MSKKALADKYQYCPKCEGRGFTIYRRWRDMMWDGYDDMQENCDYCMKHGVILKEPQPSYCLR